LVALTNEDMSLALNSLRKENRESHDELYGKADKINVKVAEDRINIGNNKERTVVLELKIDGATKDISAMKETIKSLDWFYKLLVSAMVTELLAIIGLLLYYR
jgi:hypothetical protein